MAIVKRVTTATRGARRPDTSRPTSTPDQIKPAELDNKQAAYLGSRAAALAKELNLGLEEALDITEATIALDNYFLPQDSLQRMARLTVALAHALTVGDNPDFEKAASILIDDGK